MQSNILLSIIIPLYNVEDYIERCLDSLSKQLTEEIEVIIVNDGSLDTSREKVLPYLNNFIKLIDKENGGVSTARNIGLKNSKGKFIAFVDSDDYVSDNYVQTILCKIKDTDSQLLCFNYVNSYDSHEDEVLEFHNKSFVCGEHAGFSFYLKENYDEVLKQFCLNKIYLNRIIADNDISFPIGQTVGEDFIFNIEYMEYVKRIDFSDSIIYHYYQRDNSVMHTYNRNYTRDIIKYKNHLYRIAKKSGYLIKEEDVSYLLLKCWFGVLNQECNNTDYNQAKRNVDKFLAELNIGSIKDNKLKLKFKVYKTLIKMHLSQFLLIILRFKNKFI